MAKKYTIDFCSGPMFSKIVLFTVPLVGSLLLQLAFNTADYMVVGRFGSELALAGVGATSSLTNLLTLVFFGLSVGGNVVAGNAFGARDMSLLRRTARTSLSVSVLGGLALGVIGVASCPFLLRLLRTPPDVLPLAIKYMRILFCGMVFTSAYNFGSAFLRAVGDTRRPLVFLAFAGVVNVVLNVIFVVCFKMDVAGVALATVISKAISALLVWRVIAKMDEVQGLPIKKLTVDRGILKRMLAVGVPTGLQSFSFSLANIVIQATLNSFGAMALAGNIAALSLEHLLSTVTSGFHHTSISFSAQNVGGGKFSRLKRGAIICCAISTCTTFVLSMVMLLFGRQLLSLYTSTGTEVVEWGMKRMVVLLPLYFTSGVMNTLTGTMRGSGYSKEAFIIIFIFACVFRILWIFFLFPLWRSMEMLMLVLPMSWILISIVSVIFLWRVFRKMEE